MKIGDVVVFIGQNVIDEHFKNFEFGKHYKIQSFTTLPDDESYGPHVCILFENCSWGCLSVYFDTYFIELNQHRNLKINKII